MWLKTLVKTVESSMFVLSHTLKFFFTWKSTFQEGIPTIGPTPGFLVSIPRMGARKVVHAATGLLKILTAAEPGPAIFVPTELPKASVPPGTFLIAESPNFDVVTHCSLSKK